jgi:hypothetical protein
VKDPGHVVESRLAHSDPPKDSPGSIAGPRRLLSIPHCPRGPRAPRRPRSTRDRPGGGVTRLGVGDAQMGPATVFHTTVGPVSGNRVLGPWPILGCRRETTQRSMGPAITF